MSLLSNPDVAFAALALGLLCICIEFCRPGWVWPGVLGGVLATLGFRALVSKPGGFTGAALLHPWTVAALFAPLALATGFLLKTARQARRNKKAW